MTFDLNLAILYDVYASSAKHSITGNLVVGSLNYCIDLSTVKPALKTTCIQGPPLYKDHLVVSQ